MEHDDHMTLKLKQICIKSLNNFYSTWSLKNLLNDELLRWITAPDKVGSRSCQDGGLIFCDNFLEGLMKILMKDFVIF